MECVVIDNDETETELPPAPCGCSWDNPICEEGKRLDEAIPVFPDFDMDGNRFLISEADYERATEAIFKWLAHIGYPGF